MSINTEELLQILACPRCLGSLAALGRDGQTTGFACAACEVVYPVREEIPIMLVEEAVPRARWNSEHPEDAPGGGEQR
ncbi:Trm112 family protein [Desulfovibrio sp. ZJ200]|uniref:Trm112 family protein n=1 Tax=Desulfovibrio sp. ZJ200 TaxID=2709792 RepID=UPI0013EAA3E3|nr:Trm112 family protein [Desulfovibrio sp. ZJ200]